MPGMSIDAPPSLPASTASQMQAGGDNPFAGIGAMLGGGGDQKPEQASGGSAGALKAQIDAVKGVLEKVVQSANAGKTFFSRAMQMLDQGLAAESKAGPGTPPTAQPEGGTGSEESATMSRPPAAAFAG